MSAKKLDKKLNIGGEEFEVNAVNSDIAAELANKLSVNISEYSSENNLITDISKEFNGTENISLDVVSSKGGKFTGPVEMSNRPADYVFNDDTILNCGEIEEKISQLTGSPWFTWTPKTDDPNDGYNFSAVTVDPAESSSEIKQIKRVGIVTGPADMTAANAFAEHNVNNNILPLFLYIGRETDNNGNLADSRLYFGTNTDPTVATLGNKLTSSSGTASYTYENIESNSLDIWSEINAINDLLDVAAYNTPVAVDDRIKNAIQEAMGVIMGTGESSTELTLNKLKTDLGTLSDNLSNVIDGVTDYIPAKAGSATTAEKDSSGNVINATYYSSVSAFDSKNKRIGKRIFIQSTEPTTNIAEGDIWIKTS